MTENLTIINGNGEALTLEQIADILAAKVVQPPEWMTDAELIRWSNIPEKKLRPVLRALDNNPHSGFPKKDKLWGDRRHYPSVQDYWRDEQKRKMAAPQLRRAS